MSSSVDSELSELLATIADSVKDTIADRPNQTIVPRPKRETAGERALEMLRELSGLSGNGQTAELVIGDEIARGGMGKIQSARQVALGRDVAVKSLRDRFAGDISLTLELLREAWLTGALEHPNIMPVYNIALADDGTALIVLKRIEGVTWTELMTDPDTVRERYGAHDLLEWNLEILLRVLDALRFAHNRGIIHRDVKPDNVMIGEFGEVYLVDWGIAVSLRSDPSGRLPHVSQTVGNVAGTPCYLAPEMLGDAQDERTDVYLAGAVLFELLAGRPPHDGGSVLEVLTAVATNEPSAPKGAPEELGAICTRAMARLPSDRFASADEMRGAIVEFISHRGSLKLSDAGQQRLAELRHHLAHPAENVSEKREHIFRLLGECRFGFGAALAAWPGNLHARSGLDAALSEVARFELANDDPGAADSLLTELANPPPDLRAAVDSALVERKRAREHYAALADEADMLVGNRTRVFLTIVLGTVWTSIPLVAYFLNLSAELLDGDGAYRRMVILTVGVMLFVFGLAGWARESLLRSRVNRLIAISMCTALAIQLLLVLGGAMMDLPPLMIQVLMPLIWAFGAFVLAFTELRGVLPLALGYAGAFLLSAAFPGHRMLFMAGANFIVMVNGLLLWAWFARQARPKPGPDSPTVTDFR